MMKKKTPVLKEVISRLMKDLSDLRPVVVDNWEEDPSAVGLARKDNDRVLIYITLDGDSEDLYCFECEVAEGPKQSDYSVKERKDCCDYEELRDAARRHLQDAPPSKA